MSNKSLYSLYLNNKKPHAPQYTQGHMLLANPYKTNTIQEKPYERVQRITLQADFDEKCSHLPTQSLHIIKNVSQGEWENFPSKTEVECNGQPARWTFNSNKTSKFLTSNKKTPICTYIYKDNKDVQAFWTWTSPDISSRNCINCGKLILTSKK